MVTILTRTFHLRTDTLGQHKPVRQATVGAADTPRQLALEEPCRNSYSASGKSSNGACRNEQHLTASDRTKWNGPTHPPASVLKSIRACQKYPTLDNWTTISTTVLPHSRVTANVRTNIAKIIQQSLWKGHRLAILIAFDLEGGPFHSWVHSSTTVCNFMLARKLGLFRTNANECDAFLRAVHRSRHAVPHLTPGPASVI